MGGIFNAPGLSDWRPSQLPEDEELILAAEPSPNAAGFNDGIIATPSHDKSLIIGRVKLAASQALAPLMRCGSVRVKVQFDWEKFNLRAWWMEIDVFGADATEIDQTISKYERLDSSLGISLTQVFI